MGNYLWLLFMPGIIWTQTVEAHMRNVCEGHPSVEGVMRRLVSRKLMAAVTGASISVNVALNHSESGMGRIPSDKNTALGDSSKAVAVHKGRTSFASISTPHLCLWVYRIEKSDIHHLPSYIVQAELLDKQELTFIYSYHGVPVQCRCLPIVMNLHVLGFHSCVNGTERWEQDKEAVTVGFTCVRTI